MSLFPGPFSDYDQLIGTVGIHYHTDFIVQTCGSKQIQNEYFIANDIQKKKNNGKSEGCK